MDNTVSLDEYNSLRDNYNRMLNDRNALRDGYTTLRDDYNALRDDYSTLYDNYNTVVDYYDDRYPLTTISGTQVNWEFYDFERKLLRVVHADNYVRET